MTYRMIALASGLVLGLTLAGNAQAQRLQPGMRTMIQQGGVEGTPLGPFLPYPYGADPDYGYVYDDIRYGRVVFTDPNYLRRARHRELAYERQRVRVRLRDRAGM